MQHRNAFTLIELLVVIAIIAILSVVVILVLNPGQLLEQSRDSDRVSDMSITNDTLGIYEASGAIGSLGNTSTTYVSIPDQLASTTAGDGCQGLNLPSLPTGYSYFCESTTTYRNSNGTGWLPLNLSSMAGGSPLGQLPQDAVNTTSSGEFYEYIPGSSSAGTWELVARCESQKYTTTGGACTNDGGYSTQYYELGKDATLPLNMPEDLDRVTSTDYLTFDTSGLVGYWPLNEGQGTTAYDQSGNRNNGSWSGSPPYYTTGFVGPYAGDFNGSTNYVSVGGPTSTFAFTGTFSISAWVDPSTFGSGNAGIVDNGDFDVGGYDFEITSSGQLRIQFQLLGNQERITSVSTLSLNQWQHIAMSYDGSVASLYLNGLLIASSSEIAPASGVDALCIGCSFGGGITKFAGLIDDVRVYNRALSATEIAAIYNAEN